jgi:type II secretory ATPase GspE/PulE/Tfp pilus assembly ATPase PilB-like protein
MVAGKGDPAEAHMLSTEAYLINCWNCLGEFDALAAVWCSHDPKKPTKLCPFCFRCSCEASEEYRQDFWGHAPPRLLEEVETLARSKDRLGDILIRMKKLTTPQLLDVLVEQKRTGQRLGELLVERGLVTNEDIAAALKTQGVSPLLDTRGVAYATSPVWDQSEPEAIIQYLLGLAARKGASDVQIEPKEDQIAVRYRIDGLFFRVDPIPKRFQPSLTRKLFELFRLDPGREGEPHSSRFTARLGEADYDVVAKVLPTPHGVSASIKLINRVTFIKDFTTLGMELADRVRLIEELGNPSGLVLVSSPAFNGAMTTLYAIMNFLVQGQRNVLSLEAPIQWTIEGARQVEVEPSPQGPRMEEAIRSLIPASPEVLMLSAVPDRGTALLAAQLAGSRLVIATLPAQSAGQAVAAFLQGGVPPLLLAGSLAAVTCQRLVRTVCRICRQPTEPPPFSTLAQHGIVPEEAGALRFFRGNGCPTCNTVGYRGRQAVFEVLPGAPEVRAAVQSGLSAHEIEAVALGAGMQTIREQCLHLVREGVTTFDEFARLRL